MKSLSPSAVILGPMIGILSEALIIWLMVVLFGKNLFSYMLAGALAVISALFHKLATLLVLYGFNLVRIVGGLYDYSVKQLRVESLDPLILILLIVILYAAIGAIGALLGYFTGKRQRLENYQPAGKESSQRASESELFKFSDKRRYSLVLLVVHLAMIILCLWVMNTQPLYLSVPLCVLYAVSCFAWYRASSRFLKKKGFWIQFIAITLLASLLLEAYSSGQLFSANGLIIGLMMNLRALVLMAGFTAISYELRNPVVKVVLYQRGFSSLYQSLGLAFSALPDIVSAMPDARTVLKERGSFISSLFKSSQDLLERFRHDYRMRPPVFIVTGDVNQGKSTFVGSLVKQMKEKGIECKGILAPGIYKADRKSGFYMEDVATKERSVLSLKEHQEGWLKAGHYSFDPAVIEIGTRMLLHDDRTRADLVVIDEIGPIELRNGGWAPAVETLCGTLQTPQLWVVRSTLAEKAARKWNVGDVRIYRIGQDNADELMDDISGAVSWYRSFSKEKSRKSSAPGL